MPRMPYRADEIVRISPCGYIAIWRYVCQVLGESWAIDNDLRSVTEIAQLAERRTEPNSGLGHAISYLLPHWQPLTLFLRKAGAPLDNNTVERSLKRAVLHRKNALFYGTPNGAQVEDLFMSLIRTCQLCGVNSFDNEILAHDRLAHNALRCIELSQLRWSKWA